MNIQNLDEIIENGLCAGCGICESIAGRNSVEMTLTSDQRLRPQTKSPIKSSHFEKILEVCPGITITGPNKKQAGPFGTTNKVFGPILSLYRGWAADERIRFHAAAGGALTALGIYLLESKKVDAVLHVQASSEYPLLTNSLVSTSARQLYDGSQSRYGPAAPLTEVNQLLDNGHVFAVIGKPCDIAAIKNLAKVDDRVKDQIPYTLTIFCGGVPSLRMPADMARYFGVKATDLSRFRFRGEGWPGMTHMETKDGRSFDLTYEESYLNRGASWTYDSQFRCKICPDAIGEVADVSCPDGWVIENGKPIHREAPGINIFISRTPNGEKLLRDAKSAGVITLEPFSEKELEIMHGDHIPRKILWPARMLGLLLAGKPVIKVKRYRKWKAMITTGPMLFFENVNGTFRRARGQKKLELGFRRSEP